MSPRQIVLYCGLLLTVTAFSVDITLPAFGVIADGLMADYALVQLIVPLFLFATGIGQMVVGPLADRYGRKPLIILGLVFYCLGAAVCAFAPSIEILLFGRVIQGLGASAGPVVGRAIVRDLFEGMSLAKNLALASMIFAFGPIVAPLIGVGIMAFGSWRYIFFAIAMFGIALLAIGWLSLPETIKEKRSDATRLGTLWLNTKIAFNDEQSRFYLVMAGPIMLMMLLILVSIPRVYSETFGVDGAAFAVLFALHGFGIILGQFVNRRIIDSLGTALAMKIGAANLFACTLAMMFADNMMWMSAYVLTGFMVVFATSYLVVLSNATALALGPHGSIAGFISSLYGLTSQVIASTAVAVLAIYIRGDLSAFIWALVVLSGGVLLVLLVGDPSRKCAKRI